MERRERKVETESIRITEPGGGTGFVKKETTVMRTQYTDGSWTAWMPEATRYRWNGRSVNLREDGDWETVEEEPRRLTRLP
jgi:hypothetical protein